MPTVDVALISMNDDSQEVIQNIAVFDTYADAMSLEPGYDYYIDLTDNYYSPPPSNGWIYDPDTNTFTAPPEDFVDELAAAYNNVISDIQYITTLLDRMADNDDNAGTDYDGVYSGLDLSPLPSDFASDIWPSIAAYLAAIVGG